MYREKVLEAFLGLPEFKRECGNLVQRPVSARKRRKDEKFGKIKLRKKSPSKSTDKSCAN